jgi:hypothetical protein
MADINTPILGLKTLEVNEDGANGSHVHLKGVVPGFINSILRLMGIARFYGFTYECFLS